MLELLNPRKIEQGRQRVRLLRVLYTQGMATPLPRHLDLTCEILPPPCMHVNYVEGAPEFSSENVADSILQMAAHLSRIHSVGMARSAMSFLPGKTVRIAGAIQARPERFDESLDGGHIRDVLTTVRPLEHKSAHANAPPGSRRERR